MVWWLSRLAAGGSSGLPSSVAGSDAASEACWERDDHIGAWDMGERAEEAWATVMALLDAEKAEDAE